MGVISKETLRLYLINFLVYKLEKLIEDKLRELDVFLKQEEWYGREAEVVNLFCNSFLSKSIPISRIGIEVSVKQISGSNRKKLVRKDLVIWEKENQTVWDSKGNVVNNPQVIIEWKVNSLSKCQVDIEWLKEYTKIYPNITGYSVCAFIKKSRKIKFFKIRNGEVVKSERGTYKALVKYSNSCGYRYTE